MPKTLIVLAALITAVLALGQEADAPDSPLIIVCPVTGMIDEGVSVVVKRAVKEAREQNARAIIFRVDTPGGRIDSAVETAKTIGGASCQTIAFIEGMGAISAGALISLACDDLIMTSDSNIGAATPVIASPQGMKPTSEKEISFMRAKMRALAESGDHNPDIAQAMVDKDIELRGYMDESGTYLVYSVASAHPATETDSHAAQPASPLQDILKKLTGDTLSAPETESADEEEDFEPGTVIFEDGSELVLPRGKLLTLTPKESIKYGVIPATAETLDEVVAFYGLGDNVTYSEIVPNWAERTFRFLTNPTITGLLLMLGLGGLYFEVKTPGFGVPGIIGVVSLVLLFGAHYVLGLTEVIDLVLILSGILLILVEVFVIPGFGVAGLAGIGFLVVGLYLSLVSFTLPQYSWEFERLSDVGQSMATAAVLLVILGVLVGRYLPRTSLYHQFVMSSTQQSHQGYVAQTAEDVQQALGLEGKAISMLRPAGRGRFEGKNYQVVTRGDFVDKGASIVIVEAEGNRYVVEKVKEQVS